MEYQTFQIGILPQLTAPVLIIGLRGWGNALEVSAGMAGYLVEALEGVPVGRIDPDNCYHYDENRPIVTIESGKMNTFHSPGGRLFAIKTNPGENDLMVLVADEPNLNWYRFSRELVDLAQRIAAPAVISLGSMFDHVLHTDRIISGVTTGHDFDAEFSRYRVLPINYNGPSAIHTIILDACRKRGMVGASLWCHCPAYLQGIAHHGLMHALAPLIGDMASFSLPTESLEARWQALEIQIQTLILENPKLEGIMDQIRRKKRDGTQPSMRKSGKAQGNVIDLRDFLDT